MPPLARDFHRVAGMELQLCAAGGLDAVLDRVVAAACAAVPGLDRTGARELAFVILRSRVRCTAACGRHAGCAPDAALAAGVAAPADAVMCHWRGGDPAEAAAVFGAAAADLTRAPAPTRRAIERLLARAFAGALAPFVFRNPRCGRLSVCAETPVEPFRRGAGFAPEAPAGADPALDAAAPAASGGHADCSDRRNEHPASPAR